MSGSIAAGSVSYRSRESSAGHLFPRDAVVNHGPAMLAGRSALEGESPPGCPNGTDEARGL